jgi:hypothetical protein
MVEIQPKKLRMLQKEAANHPVFEKLTSIDNLRTFMEFHVFAVWDFMSILKSLQAKLTCVKVPWTLPKYGADATRFVNEIVLDEEGDIGPDGKPTSHFELYLKAMDEINANKDGINKYLLGKKKLTGGLKEFVDFNINLAKNGTDEEVAAAFLYGREKLIPEMFSSILKVLKNNAEQYPSLIYYLERHIECDEEDHGPRAEECLKIICGDDPNKWENAYKAGEDLLKIRQVLWNTVLERLE